MINFQKIQIALLIPVLYFLFFGVALAQELILNSSKTVYRVGDSFQVSLTIDTKGQSINTISGSVQVPEDKFSIIDTRYGNSIISLWVSRPQISGNVINFAGGTPGGFSGSAGPILSFGLKAKATGDAIITLDNINVLLNDGNGTELKMTSKSLKLTIDKALPVPLPAKTIPTPSLSPTPASEPTPEEVYSPPLDTVTPENFIPVVGRDSSVADNKFFVSFFAVDKDTGIDHYEIIEKPFLISYMTSKFNTDSARGESPYVLRWQIWPTKIIVRAYDQAGNFKEAYTTKPMHPGLLWSLVALLLAVAILVTRYIYKPRKMPRRLV